MQRVRSLKTALFALTLSCLVPVNIMAQSGKVIDAATGAGIPNAAVMIKTGENLLAHARTLTDSEGNFWHSHFKSSAIEVADGGKIVLVIRKAGYLPKTLTTDLFGDDGDLDAGTVSLERDPLEKRIDSVMALMTTAQKIAQMTQPELGGGVSSSNNGTSLYGSVLNGGGGYSSTFFGSMVTNLNTWSGAKIPTSYGKDAVHGNAGIAGYTVFPHNIGLGATRDSALVRRIGEATAKELWAAGIDLNFSPAISAAQNPRWGRTYESYGETAELSVQMGAAMVRGLQGERYDAPWRVTATAKHYLGDGGTTNGTDRGNTAASDEELRAVHLPGYEAVVEQGVLSVMASFNTINNIHQHIDSLRLTGWLKTELGFDGYIISDWLGIGNSLTPGEVDAGNYAGGGFTPTPTPRTKEAINNAINAGIDLAMEPGTHEIFMQGLKELIDNGSVSEERVNDAVRRILRAKFRAGRMDNFSGPAEYVGNTANRASAEHRAIAREAAAKSLVLLKNENAVLPLSKTAGIHVFGSHHNNIGFQCGGWTISWQGVTGNTNFTGVGTSILSGMQQVSGQTVFAAAANAGIIVYVTGEEPYAEWRGDITSLNFSPTNSDMTALANYRSQGKKIVTIFVSGRPRIVPELIDVSDAFLAAWLPGTEGGGVADVLFGDKPFTGKLPFTWPNGTGTPSQFPYGYGLPDNSVSVMNRGREIPSPNANPNKNEPSGVNINELVYLGASQLTAGPNPVSRSNGIVNFFWQGKVIDNAALSIYDASGNLIRKIKIRDKSTGSSERRLVGSWDFKNSKNKIVSEGSYAVKGNIKIKDGKREKISIVLGVK